MKSVSRLTVLGLVLTTGATLLSPAIASADGLQSTKNMWRNIATGAAVLAGIGIANHNSTETAVGAIGTVVGLSQYESARQQQSQEQNGYWGRPTQFDNSRTNIQFDVRDNVRNDNRDFDRNDNRSNFRPGDRDNNRNDNRGFQDQGQNDRSQRNDR